MSLEYKGYSAGPISFDDEAGLFVGSVAGIRDCLIFQGTNADELRRDFRDLVDEYLETCAEMGKTPDKPASGKVMLRIAPRVHAAISAAADAAGQSLNKWAEALFARETGVALRTHPRPSSPVRR
ncbi:MAG: type II toxin-antitoxin system HicB family antitoxin [Rhodocyclaceae bacterium]|nr:type II toxin-antitoxin system HicB family antitoxin [Rhodocyclaceae bacterium]